MQSALDSLHTARPELGLTVPETLSTNVLYAARKEYDNDIARSVLLEDSFTSKKQKVCFLVRVPTIYGDVQMASLQRIAQSLRRQVHCKYVPKQKITDD